MGRGEAEEKLVKLVDLFEKHGLDGWEKIYNIPNFWIKDKDYKNNGVVHKNPVTLPDISKGLPPDLSIFDPRHFLRPLGGRMYNMATVVWTRGCVFRCSYCANETFYKAAEVSAKEYYRKKDADLLSDLKTFLGLSFTVLFLISVWLFLQWLRGGASADFIFYPVLNTIKSAVFGTTAAFTTWLQHFHQHGAAFGLYTFAGPLDLIGVKERQLGFYADFITLPTGYTNIYTAFRGLIQDFTIPGSIFICLLIGFLIQLAYLRCRDGNIIWVLPLSLFYAFPLFSPFISIFTSNSVTTAWLFALVVLAFHKKKNAISYSRDTIYNR